MTPADLLRQMIHAHGPISMAEFMAMALNHPGGVYAGPAIGAGGHFTTAPEISQIFGELLGLALVQAWLDQGSPTPFILAEAGPGRGTLMADLLRAARVVPAFLAASRLHLIETSRPLRQVQAERLEAFSPVFHDELRTLPEDAPLLLVANEFLDALPIRQFVRTGQGWRERLVALDQAGHFVFTVGPLMPAGAKPGAAQDLVETAPAREAWVGELAARLQRQGGLALLLDYGEDELAGETLQAVLHHDKVAPLEHAGEADISSHVAFAPLAERARLAGARVHGPLPQGLFLERLGGRVRLARLCAGLDASAAEAQEVAYRRLTAEDQMGLLFKAMAVVAEGSPPPAGFAAA